MAGNNLHVSDGVGVINTPTITGIRAVGNNIIQCDSLAHFPTGKFYATTYGTKTDTAGNTVVDESTIQDFVGTALNNQITILSFCPGYTDKGNKAGDYVVVKPTAASANDVADRLDTTVYDHALASVNNENLSLLSPGVVSGLAITAPTSGTTVSIGGSLTVVDEAIVADTNGKKSRIVSATKAATQLNIAIPSMTSGQSVNIAIIAHKASTANNGTWAYVAVPGTPATAGSQLPPTKAQIESVVPSGANGQFYAIIATAIVPQGSSSITQGMVSINNSAILAKAIDNTTSTAPDSNGWYVQNYGKYKRYFKDIRGTYNFPSGDSWPVISQPPADFTSSTRATMYGSISSGSGAIAMFLNPTISPDPQTNPILATSRNSGATMNSPYYAHIILETY